MRELPAQFSCLICGHTFVPASGQTVRYPIGQERSFQPEQIIFCPSCEGGSAWPLPRQEEIEKHYSTGEYWKDSGKKVSFARFPGHLAMAKSRWDFCRKSLDSLNEPLRVLDIGAGLGFFGLAACATEGVRVAEYVHLEADAQLGKALTAHWPSLKTSTRLTTLLSVAELEGEFDIIVFSHVLEHVEDPRGFLRVVAEHLRPGGYIFIDVPNSDYRYKKDVFPHVSFFKEESLRRLLLSGGLKVVDIITVGLSYKNAGRVMGGLRDQWLYRLRAILPLGLNSTLYRKLYCADNVRPDGIWLRAIARKSK